MDIGDVITLSPIGIVKSFRFPNSKLSDCEFPIEKNELLCWDPQNINKIISAGISKAQRISLIDSSAVSFTSPEYESDSSNPIGISADKDYILIGKSSGNIHVLNVDDLSPKQKISIGGNLSFCKSFNSSIICGGKNNAFRVYDVNNSQQALFCAKNVRPDTLELKVPIWLSDASFVQGYENSLFLTASRHGDFSVYDIRSSQRRPVCRSAWRVSRKHGKKSVGTGYNPAMILDLTVTRPVTKVVAFASGPGIGLRAVAANAIGDLCLLDFRVPNSSFIVNGDSLPKDRFQQGKSFGSRAAVPPSNVQTFIPAVGSISGLFCGGAGCANIPHVNLTSKIINEPLVLSSSMDRFFRIYHRDSGELLSKVFVKTPISTFLVKDSAEFTFKPVKHIRGTQLSVEEEEKLNENIKESDKIWESMEPVIVKTIPALQNTTQQAVLEDIINVSNKKKKKMHK